jgi:hypothetical protein
MRASDADVDVAAEADVLGRGASTCGLSALFQTRTIAAD